MGQQAHIILIVLLGIQWFVCWRLAFRLLPPGTLLESGATLGPKVSIIIPARNEESNLPTLLQSLATQKLQPLEIIVVDDDSDDATAAIAKRHGVTVIYPGPPPSGWRGKTWACKNGGDTATGEYLLFLDADTRIDSDHGFSRLLELYPGGAWSLLPWHDVRSNA